PPVNADRVLVVALGNVTPARGEAFARVAASLAALQQEVALSVQVASEPGERAALADLAAHAGLSADLRPAGALDVPLRGAAAVVVPLPGAPPPRPLSPQLA